MSVTLSTVLVLKLLFFFPTKPCIKMHPLIHPPLGIPRRPFSRAITQAKDMHPLERHVIPICNYKHLCLYRHNTAAEGSMFNEDFRGEQLRETGSTERLQQCKIQLPKSLATANSPHRQTLLSNILVLTSQKP